MSQESHEFGTTKKILIFTENVLIFYLLNLLALGVLFCFVTRSCSFQACTL